MSQSEEEEEEVFDSEQSLMEEMSQSLGGSVDNKDLKAQLIIAKYCFLRVQQFHYKKLAFCKIRGRLIDGASKMYKVEKTDELEKWLEAKELPTYEDVSKNDKQITLDQATEFVRLFWPKEKVTEFGDKIFGIYKAHRWGIYMIGSTQSLGEGNKNKEQNEKQVANSDDEESDSDVDEVAENVKQNSHIEFKQAGEDFKAYKERLTNTAQIRINTQVIVDYQYIQPTVTKVMMLNALKKCFKDAVDKEVSDLMLYYSGHGHQGTGEWLVYLNEPSLEDIDERITVQEIFQLIYESRFDGVVQIESDSCYAGQLCFGAKKEWERRCLINENYLQVFQLIASSHKLKKSVWGEFSKMKRKAKKIGNTKEEAIAHTDTYQKQFGLTAFKSNCLHKKGEKPIEEKLPECHTNTPEEEAECNWSQEYLDWLGNN